MLLHKYFKKYVFSSFIQENSMFDQVNYYKYIYNINLYYVSICEKYNVFHNVKTFITQQYINNPIFINVIDYNNNYFDTLPNSANSYIAIDI
jgi:hypothetical protein